jgi:hypothetical protein
VRTGLDLVNCTRKIDDKEQSEIVIEEKNKGEMQKKEDGKKKRRFCLRLILSDDMQLEM